MIIILRLENMLTNPKYYITTIFMNECLPTPQAKLSLLQLAATRPPDMKSPELSSAMHTALPTLLTTPVLLELQMAPESYTAPKWEQNSLRGMQSLDSWEEEGEPLQDGPEHTSRQFLEPFLHMYANVAFYF